MNALHDAEGETCVECGEPIQGDGFRCEGGVFARPGEASRPAPCGQPKHSGDCTREHLAKKGLSRARVAERERLHERSERQRAGWHGAARGRGTGL